MITENRIYKTKKSNKMVKVTYNNGISIHGVFVNKDLTETGAFTSSLENFRSSVYKSPVKISNWVTIKGENIKADDSKVIYTHAIVCTSKSDNHISSRCLSFETAESSMSRIVSETKSLGYEKRFSYSIAKLKHEVA